MYVHAHPDVGVLVVSGKIQHVIQSQHARRNLGEIHSWIHMVLRDIGGGGGDMYFNTYIKSFFFFLTFILLGLIHGRQQSVF